MLLPFGATGINSRHEAIEVSSAGGGFSVVAFLDLPRRRRHLAIQHCNELLVVHTIVVPPEARTTRFHQFSHDTPPAFTSR